MKTLANFQHLSQPIDIAEDIFDVEDAYEGSIRLTERDDRQGVFHPSAIGMCGRRNVYEVTRAPRIKTIEPEDHEIFELGHAVHDIVQRRLENLSPYLDKKNITYTFRKELGYDPKTDVLYQEYKIGGTTDGLLEILGEDWFQRGIIEVKSIKGKGFEELRGPKLDHLMQAHLYSFRFEAPIIWVWYVNKDDATRKIFTSVFSPSIFNKAVERYSELLDHALKGTLPDREESWYMCPRCEYRHICTPKVLLTKRKRYERILTDIRRKRSFSA